jgi:hypothetical protein
MRSTFFILLIGLVICAGVSPSQAESEAEKAAVSAARIWLTLTDGGSYSSSWKEASGYFQGAVTEEHWGASMEGFRKPLGKLIRRKTTKTQESTSLPGAPDGKYVVILFQTSFERKKSAVETVTFMLEEDGKWRAAGYFIK